MQRSTWANGQPAAVCLTYDDAHLSHFQTVAPDLESHGFRGTFFLDVAREAVTKYADEWKKIASAGHELGNHSCFHPCRGNQNRTWLAGWKDLKSYNKERHWAELQLANNFLQLIDGEAERSYGNTCHDNLIGTGEEEVEISSYITELCVAARGPIIKAPFDPVTVDLGQMGNIGADFQNNTYLLDHVDQAIESQGGIIITFHAVGEDGYRLSYDKSEHDALLQALAERPVTVAPLRNVAGWINALRAESST